MTPNPMPMASVGTTDATPAQISSASAVSYRPPAFQPMAESETAMVSTQRLEYRPLLIVAAVIVGAFLAGLALGAIQEWAARYGGWALTPIARRWR